MTPTATQHAEEKTSVVHVNIEQQTAELVEQAVGTEFDNSEVVFDADAFTIYAIVYTYQVEYEYEVDGKTFTSSMPGAENMTLTQIVEGLGIVGETEIETFVSKIASIASSNEEVAVVNENNEIRVLKDGEAKIVITMQDGAKFHIDVRAEGETSASNETATVSTKGDLYLPADAELKAEVLDEVKSESAIATVEAQEGTADSNAAAVETAYQVFDISLENVEADQYDGFQVEVILPENVVGRDFRLYHIHNGETTEIELNTVSRPADDTGLEVVSGFTFETKDFSEFVLRYTVDFTYEGRTWSFPGEGSYRLADILAALGIEGSIDDAALTLIEGEDHAGALYLTQVDGEYYINSDVAFFDTYELRVTVGEKGYLILVTDLQYTTNLSQVLTDLTIVGAEWDPATQSYTVKPGKPYTVNMTFEEGEGAGQYQFSNTEWMTLTLPEGVSFDGSTPSAFDIYVNEAGDNFTITGNQVVVEGNTIKVKLNENDPNYQKLRNLTTAQFSISVTGVFNEEWHQHEIDGQTHVTIKVDDTPDVDVRKSGSITDWNSYPDKATVTYQLEVRSNGNTSGVVITDTIQGTGLQFNQDSIRITQNGQPVTGWKTTVQSTTGFTLKTGELHDGQIYIVTYTATLDKSELDLNGDGTYSIDANNKVEWPGKTTTYDLDHIVDNNPNIKKTGHTVNPDDPNYNPDEPNKRTTTWTIEADSDFGDLNQLKKIKDHIATEGVHYSGTGLKVVITDRVTNDPVTLSGQPIILDWQNDLHIDPETATSWEYDFSELPDYPNEGKKYHYVITYTTSYDIGDSTNGINIKNDWEDEHHHEGTSTSWVEPNPENKYGLEKEFTGKEIDSNGDRIVTWTIKVTIPASGLPAADAVLTDVLPSTGNYQDTFVSFVGATGLYENEDETVEVDTTSEPGKVLFTFKTNGNNGLKPSTDDPPKAREIVLTLKTKCDSGWLNDDTVGQTHTNEAIFHGEHKYAYYTPEKPSISKTGWRDGEEGGLPKFSYSIVAGVFTEDLFKADTPPYHGSIKVGEDAGGKYVYIEDIFDENLAYVEGSAKVFGGNQYWQGNGETAIVPVVDVNNHKITFKFYRDSLPKNAGNLYQYYRVNYSLQVKDEATLNALRNEAIANGKPVKLGNTVEGFGEHTIDVEYEPDILDKWHIVKEDDKLEFTVTVNKEGLKLSDNGVLVLTDEMTNLSVRYQDISIAVAGNKTVETTDADGNPVTAPYFNMKGNRITFYLPDGAPTTIKYLATPRGEVGADGNIQYSNKVRLNGFEKTDSGNKTFKPEGAGYGTNYGVYIYKADGLVNSNALAGAVFKLYEADEVDANGNIVSGTPVKTADGSDYTVTTSDGRDGSQKGVVLVMGNEELGWNLKPEKRYYLLETKAPEGYALDNTKYSFIISKEGYVNYSSSPIAAPDGSGKLIQAWTYHNGDVMTVKNWRKDGVLTLEKSFEGIDPSKMDDDQKAAIKFEIYTVKEGMETLWRTITYDQFSLKEDGSGVYAYTIGDLPEGTYKVVEKVDDETCTVTTYAVVDTDPESAASDTYATIMISAEDVRDHIENKVSITNTYDVPSEFKIYKHAKGEASHRLPGAEFGVYNTNSGEPTGQPIATYTTNSRGRFVILQDQEDESGQLLFITDKIYALKETKAPDGFLLNDKVILFCFLAQGTSQDSITLPEGVSPKDVVWINWKQSDVEQNIEDTPKTTYLEAKKRWLNDLLEEDDTDKPTSITIRVKQTASLDQEGKIIEPALSGYYSYNSPTDPVIYELAPTFTIVKDTDTGKWHLADQAALINGENTPVVVGGKLINLPTMIFKNSIPYYFTYEVEEVLPAGYENYVPRYEYTTNDDDGGIHATVSNRPNNVTTTVQLKAQKKWVDIDGADVTSKMGLDDGVKVGVYRYPGIIYSGKIYDGGTPREPLDQISIGFIDGIGGTGTLDTTRMTVLDGDRIEIRIKPISYSYTNATFDTINYSVIQVKIPGTSGGGYGINNSSTTTRTKDVSTKQYVVQFNVTKECDGKICEITNLQNVSEYSIEVRNLSAEGRRQVLTQSEVALLENSATKVETLELSLLNSWHAISRELPVGTSTAPYSYFLVEENGEGFDASYSMEGDIVTVTNVEKKIEVQKIWQAANGDVITNSYEDGLINFKLYQTPYNGEVETVGINYSQLIYGRPDYNAQQATSVTRDMFEGRLSEIKKGSTVTITVTTEGSKYSINTLAPIDHPERADNMVISMQGETYEGIIGENEVIDSLRARKTKTFKIENVTDTLILKGCIFATLDQYKVTIKVDVSNEPEVDTTIPLGSKVEVGTITVKSDSASFTPTNAFKDIGITVKPGTDVWSAVLNKLPAAGYNATYEKTVVYKYSVEEVETEGFELVSISGSAAAGGKIEAVNKLKSGSLKVKKIVEGAAPDDKTYEIAVTDAEGNYYGADGTNYGQTPHYEVFSANDENSWKTWAPLNPGTYTVSEKNASVEGYTWTVSGVGAVKVQQDKTAEATVTNSYFKNAEYTPKVTKSLKTGEADVSPWPDGISFEFYLSFVSGSNESTPLSSTDVVMTNRSAEATETNKTAEFGKIEFKKPGEYNFKIEEVEPAGTQNHKKDGVVYSTVPVTLAVEVGPKDGEPGVLEVKSKTYSPANGTLEEGLITNTMDYPSYAPSVTKVLKNGETDVTGTNWGDRSFRFTLANTTTGDLSDHVIMPSSLTRTVTKNSTNHKETFDAITFKAAGDYTFTITETVPDDATNAAGKKYSEATDAEKTAGGFSLNGVTYDGEPKSFTVTVATDAHGNLAVTKVTVAGTEITGEAIIGSGVTVKNTLVEKTDFEFSKVWLAMTAGASEVSSDDLQTWPTGKSITVKIFRKNGDSSTATVDQNFELIYTINGSDTPISPTSGKVNGQSLNDTDKATYRLTMTGTVDGKIITFKTDKVLDLKNADTNWVYYVEETSVPEGYLKDGYGTMNSDEETGTTIKKAPGAEAAASGGVILNRESSGYELPETGGIGTALFTALGGLMTVAAGAVLTLRRKRKS